MSSSSGTSAASLTVQMNSPPSSGVLLIEPTEGTALETVFLLRSLYWVDDIADYPLSYKIMYYTRDAEILSTVKPSSEGSSVYTFLSQGLESLGYIVTCVVQATDIHGTS